MVWDNLTQRSVSRRKFIETCALVGGLVPPGLSVAQPVPPANLRLAKPVLSPADITYKGLFKLPLPSSAFSFSRGGMTARTVNGQLRFLINGEWRVEPVIEVSYPGFGSNLANAPRATLIRNWGDVYGGRRLVGDPNEWGLTWGLKWYEGLLYWSYVTGYEGNNWNPALGASFLNDSTGASTAFGPWRATVHSGLFNAHMTEIPTAFRTEHKVGALAHIPSVHGGQSSSPWGCTAWAFDPPNTSTPPDPNGLWGSSAQKVRSITAKALSFHGIDHPQTRTVNFKVCGWNSSPATGSPDYSGSLSSWVKPANPVWGGGHGIPSLDWVDTGVWIDLPTKHGMLMMGQMADTIPGFAYPNGETQAHHWYGRDICPHGQDAKPVYQATGPGTGTLVNTGWIYDPADYGRVLRGEVPAHGLLPRHQFQANAIGGFSAVKRSTLYEFGGMHFDPATQLLFLVQRMAYMDGYDPVPAIHVFQIS